VGTADAHEEAAEVRASIARSFMVETLLGSIPPRAGGAA
jgi:hypothetical protein